MPSKAQYISNLTPLRGIAALLVAIFHFEMAIARFVPAKTTMFFEKSYLMVDLFFIMSGFIIFHVYGQSFKAAIGADDFRQFIVARIARIYPLHFFTLALLIFMVIYVFPPGTYPNKMEFPSAIPSNFLLLQSFHVHSIYTWNIPSWSISAEFAAYLVFPFIALWIAKSPNRSKLILLVFTVAAYLSIMYLIPRYNPLNPNIPVPHNVNTTYDFGFLRGIAGFVAGVLLYQFYSSDKIRRVFGSDFFAVGAITAVVCALHFGLNDGVCVFFFAMIVLSFACNRTFVAGICSWAPLQFLGLISYSIYLMQIFFQEPFSKGWRLPGVTGFGRGKQNIGFGPGLLYCLVYLVLLIGVSTLSYYLIENPARKFIKRKWGNRKTDADLRSELARV